MSASGAAVRTPVKKNGIVFGSRTFFSVSNGEAAYDRISSIWVASFCRRPLATCTNTTKNTEMVTMMRRGIWLSSEYMLFSTPTMTTAGMAATVMASGFTSR